MFKVKFIIIMAASLLLVGCGTGRYSSDMQGNQELPKKMGVRYLLGRGVQQNDGKAFGYFLSDADNGDPFAQNEVAYMYATGKGTSQNYQKALEYYLLAAQQGLASAQYNLGLMYLYGLGTPPNKPAALHWIQKAAEHGFEPAKSTLKKVS